MWFKHLSFYRLPQPWTLSAAALEEKLAPRPLTPCPAGSLSSTGWVPPAQDAALVYAQEGQLLIALGTEQKLLPGSVIKDAAALRAQEYERTKGFKPGRKALREIREVVAAELLPRAFTRRSQVRAWIDPAHARLVVETTAPSRAEWLLQHLREALGSLEVQLPETRTTPAATLTAWLAAGQAPGDFSLEDECELSGSHESRPVIRYLRHPLVEASLRKHLDAGMQATRLALGWRGQLSLVINQALQLKRVKFLDLEGQRETDPELNPELAFEADFALMTGTYAALLDEIEQVFAVQAG
jgi:recombination associated protein RdgC